jgi:hypothetical protein
MTAIIPVSKKEMEAKTGFRRALGYSLPKENKILIRKGLPADLKKEVLAHEEEHMEKGEEGPFAWGALIGGALSLFGAKKQSSAAKKATRAGQQATDKDLAFQRESRDQVRSDTEPYRQAGANAISAASDMTGLTDNGYDWQTDPGYQFRLDEGMRALERSGAARGGVLSGGFGRKAIRYGQNFASNEYSNVYNRIMGIAGMGQFGTTLSANASTTASGRMGAAVSNQGATRASGYTARGNIAGSAIEQVAKLPWTTNIPMKRAIV